MGIACIGGGIAGYLRTGSKPSLIAGVAVGALYLWSGGSAFSGDSRGYYGAAGEQPCCTRRRMDANMANLAHRCLCYPIPLFCT